MREIGPRYGVIQGVLAEPHRSQNCVAEAAVACDDSKMRSRTFVFVFFAATMLFSIVREWSAPTGCLRLEMTGQRSRHR